MKVLYVYNFNYPDYMSDCVYHGLIDRSIQVYETSYPFYMLDGYYDPEFYGNGFTLYSRLYHLPQVESREEIIEKIRSKFYDIVIYGCVYTFEWIPDRQCLDYLDEVIQYYPRTKIHFIDGSDDTKNFAQAYNLDQYGIVWKRELVDYVYGNPISFAIPESQIRKNFLNKDELYSSQIIRPTPNSFSNRNNYTFLNEQEYYNAYARSYYGFTCKKGGWDCMRHYEILANKTIPAFFELENCPNTIMTNFPKNIILEVNKYSLKNQVHPNYNELNDYIFEYTKNNLTTKKLVERFL